MSEVENFENEGGLVPETDKVVEQKPATEPPKKTRAKKPVELTLAPGNSGVYFDKESGQRFKRGVKTPVDAKHVDRLLELRRRGNPLIVRATD